MSSAFLSAFSAPAAAVAAESPLTASALYLHWNVGIYRRIIQSGTLCLHALIRLWYAVHLFVLYKNISCSNKGKLYICRFALVIE
jgi:hypothetical protein